MQTYSFIIISDSNKKQEILEAIGHQKCMEEAPVVIMTCIDFARQPNLFKLLKMKTEFGEVSKFLSGIIDAVHACMMEYYEKANKPLIKMRYLNKAIKSRVEHWQVKFPAKEMKNWEQRLREDLKKLGFLF